MKKYWLAASALSLSMACGATEDEVKDLVADDSALEAEEAGLGQEDVEIGLLEQHLDEATCGTTASVNNTADFKGSNIRFVLNAPYGSTACTSAAIVALKSSTPRGGRINIIGQLNVPRAQCPQARLVSDYYRNGATVLARVNSGPGVFRNGNCLVSTRYEYRGNGTNSVVGNLGVIAGTIPPAADNARFVAQAVNHLGQIQKFTWEINP